MPDFNKGDFTQQGVNGHVNATVRLNEKRLVNIDMTSNEEAAGCTITGTVQDLLNDKVYGIGSGVSGNIEITENGENINVAPYATATVNVAGGGGTELLYCDITLHNSVNSQTSISCSSAGIQMYGYLKKNNCIELIQAPLHTPPTDEIEIGGSITYRLYYDFENFIAIGYSESDPVTINNSSNMHSDTTDGTIIYVPTDGTANSAIDITVVTGK